MKRYIVATLVAVCLLISIAEPVLAYMGGGGGGMADMAGPGRAWPGSWISGRAVWSGGRFSDDSHAEHSLRNSL